MKMFIRFIVGLSLILFGALMFLDIPGWGEYAFYGFGAVVILTTVASCKESGK